MKKLALFLVLLSAFVSASAQKKQNVYFLKNSGREVVRDSADFIRVIQEPDSGSAYFSLLEFYLDGKRKAVGTVSAFSPRVVYEGQLLSFYKKGTKRRLLNFRDGKVTGLARYYFGNGELQKTVEYPDSSGFTDVLITPVINAGDLPPGMSKLIFQADSSGKVMVKDGNGHVSEIENAVKETTVEGDYKDGLKDGLWEAKSKDGNYWYKEQYAAGKLISGQSGKDGKTYTYKNLFEGPGFKGGMNAFYNYLSYTIKYPRDAQENRIQGKVFLSFVVETDGKLTDIKVVRSLYPSLDEEAMRALRYSPRWMSGTNHGVPIRVKYNIPVNFNLNR